LKVKYVDHERKFEVFPEIFANYEKVFYPVCGLDHQVIEKTSQVIVKIDSMRIKKYQNPAKNN